MIKCKQCGNPTHNKKFCSLSCSSTYLAQKQRDKYIFLWKNGELTGNRGVKCISLSSHVRSYLLEEANYRCSQCGWGKRNKYTNTIPLEIDHIDGNPLNSIPENLRVLCPNCHSLTKGHSSSKGRGRRYYRQKHHKELNLEG